MERREIIQTIRILCVLAAVFCSNVGAQIADSNTPYSGGNGTADDPYQIATPEDLIALGNEPNDYDKHFVLTTDIDLVGSTFDQAVIAADIDPSSSDYNGDCFAGSFDGNGHVIRHLHIKGDSYLGLFGMLDKDCVIVDLGLEDCLVEGLGRYIGSLAGWSNASLTGCYSRGEVRAASRYTSTLGGLVGYNLGTLTDCHAHMAVTGEGSYAGGLVGYNRMIPMAGGAYIDATLAAYLRVEGGGVVSHCSSTGSVTSEVNTGGLIGFNDRGIVSSCYSTADVTGEFNVGGLVGENDNGRISSCYSSGPVIRAALAGGLPGSGRLGGLIGDNSGAVLNCYSTGEVIATPWGDPGGLVAGNSGSVVRSFWDMESSRMADSPGGVGLTTVEMMDPNWISLQGWADDPNWVLNPYRDYPRLVWEGTSGRRIPEPVIDWIVGDGTNELPYEIDDPNQLIWISKAPVLWDKDMKLTADLDLIGTPWLQAVIGDYTATFDGNGHVIRNLNIFADGDPNVGLFGFLREGGLIVNLGISDANVVGRSQRVGGLLGYNHYGKILNCYCTGQVAGRQYVGGLVGETCGIVFYCYSVGMVTGTDNVGGLAGCNAYEGSISGCFSDCVVNGVRRVGGLIGCHGNVRGLYPTVSNCYSTGPVEGNQWVGGLIGNCRSFVSNCYSISSVAGEENVGGLVGDGWDSITGSFWDIETSGQTTSDAGIGLTTAQMMDIDTYLEAGWDLLGESSNGTAEIWVIPEEENYPRLSVLEGIEPVMPEGRGTETDPYLITDAQELGSIGYCPLASYRLEADLDLSGITWSCAVVPWFGGHFDGNHHVIRHLDIQGGASLGLFGSLDASAVVKDLGLEDVNVHGLGYRVAMLASRSQGTVTNCYSVGDVVGELYFVGGLIGQNDDGTVLDCHSTGTVSAGRNYVGGLVGSNDGGIVSKSSATGVVSSQESCVGGLIGSNDYEADVSRCFTCGEVFGKNAIGGLIGINYSQVSKCYSTSTVTGIDRIGGLVGSNYRGHLSNCYSLGSVTGDDWVGGLVGENSSGIINCYSVGAVAGIRYVGGLTGSGAGEVFGSFWDVQTSGLTDSFGGVGLTTDQMQDMATFLEAGWDFVGETGNGVEDIWWMEEGRGYPRLWWELE